MTDAVPVARSPLDGMELPAGLREVPFVAQVDLRADPADQAVMRRLPGALGIGLPLEPNTVVALADGSRYALWLAPDEWLVLAEPGSVGALETAARAALAGTGTVVDVSANRTMLSLSGPQALDVLASGCSIDLDPRAFVVGKCAQTMLAHANVILFPVGSDHEPDVRILVRPSFARYLVAWIEDALGA